MKDSKYIFNTDAKSNVNSDLTDYRIIVIIRYFESYILINQNGKYDFIRFHSNSFEDENILNELKKNIGLELKLAFRCSIKDKNTGELNYILTASIDSIELNNIKEYKDIKICNELYIKNNFTDDKHELLNFIRVKSHFENVLFLIIPIGLLTAFAIFIFNLINGKVVFELLAGFIVLIIIIVIGLLSYKKK